MSADWAEIKKRPNVKQIMGGWLKGNGYCGLFQDQHCHCELGPNFMVDCAGYMHEYTPDCIPKKAGEFGNG